MSFSETEGYLFRTDSPGAVTGSGAGTFMAFVTLDACLEGDHSIIDPRWSVSSVAGVKAETLDERFSTVGPHASQMPLKHN